MIAIKRRIAQHAAAAGPSGGGVDRWCYSPRGGQGLKGRPTMTIVTNSLTIAADPQQLDRIAACGVRAHVVDVGILDS
jgi:hypothetical protein